MQVTRHIMSGTVVRPKDADEMAFVMDWTGDPERASLSENTIELGLEGYQVFMNHIDQYGASEGIPYYIEIDNVGTLKYYIDPRDAVIRKPDNGDRTITVTIKPRFTNFEFNERAKGTTFELLKRKGAIKDSDLIDIPYLIIKDNQVEQLVTLAIATFSVAKETYESVKRTSELVDEAQKAATPNPIVPNPSPSVEIDVKGYISLAVKIAINIAYTVLMIIALTNLIRQIIELIYPKLRNFKGMKLKRMIEIGCEYLGYELESSILDDEFGLTVLPVPLAPRNKSFWDDLIGNQNDALNYGYPTYRDTIDTLDSAIEAVKTTYNAELFVSGNTVKIEQEETFESQSSVTLANTYNNQDGKGQDEIQINTDDWFKRYVLKYSTDFSDKHTADIMSGSGVEYSTEPSQVLNDDLVRIEGYMPRNIPFALGSRKNDLNFVENAAKGIAKAADLFMGTSLVAKIENRKGALQISSQFFETTKLLWTSSGKQPQNYMDFLSADVIFNKYHRTNAVANSTYTIKESMTIPMDSIKFNDLLENNFVNLETGETVKILNIQYMPEMREAEVTYRIKNDYGDNTTLLKVYEG